VRITIEHHTPDLTPSDEYRRKTLLFQIDFAVEASDYQHPDLIRHAIDKIGEVGRAYANSLTPAEHAPGDAEIQRHDVETAVQDDHVRRRLADV
jgi:hypothetical protein